MIEVRTDDLAFVTADAIARPVDAELRATTPLMRRLELAGGEKLTRHLRVNEPLAVGSAVVTSAGDLGVELLIHGVVSSDVEPPTRATVRQAVSSALQRAADWQIAHLAIAPFGIGVGNLDVEDSAQVELRHRTILEEILGDGEVEGIRVRDVGTGASSTLPVAAVFANVGRVPNTSMLEGVVALDEHGHVRTDIWMRTEREGLFAAGDVRADAAGQAISAAGDGATAAVAAHRYLADRAR